ncbi:serine protease 40-like [Prionailurus iriomotensis]
MLCGKPAVTGKIFGGQNAPDRRWPWQASLLYHGKHICGAALIDAYWVISAAHCFQNKWPLSSDGTQSGEWAASQVYPELTLCPEGAGRISHLKSEESDTEILCSFDLGAYWESHQKLSKDRFPEATDRQESSPPDENIRKGGESNLWNNGSHEPSDYQVLLGYHQLQHPTEHSRQMTVYRVIVHNDFNKRYYMGSDIALLQLHLSVNFTSHILPACLPGPTMKLPLHNSCWITGWGMITEDDFLAAPFQLQEGEVGIIDSEVCKMYFQSPDSSSSEYSIHEDMFCAGDLMTGKSICRGDSGGPLVCKLNGGTWFLMGLSSWSQACRYPIGPSVFTRLTYFSHWISEKRSTLPNPDPSFAPSQDKPPILSDFSSLGTVHKPSTCITLVSLQTFLLLLIFLKIL